MLQGLVLSLIAVARVGSESSCQHSTQPILSFCEGCPPMFEGKPCASTTWYNDLTKGACGCGTEPNPPEFWSKAGYTCAANAMLIDDVDPYNAWCPSNCGLCFRLCTTGGTTNGEPSPAGECEVFQVENRCGDGYGEAEPYLCGQELSPWECLENPGACQADRSTNMFGYPAHFDLQNAMLQITEGKGWHNPEVTWEEVDCSEGDTLGDWEEDCYCDQGTSPWGPPTTSGGGSQSTTTTTAVPKPTTTTTAIPKTSTISRTTTTPGGGGGTCAGGSLEVCISLCPLTPVEIYQHCVQQCIADCSLVIR